MDMMTAGVLLCTAIGLIWALAEAVERLPK